MTQPLGRAGIIPASGEVVGAKVDKAINRV